MSALRGQVRRTSVVAALALLAGAGVAGAQPPVYRTGFADGRHDGWSTGRLFAASTGNTLLGRFHNESVSLTLDHLPPHGAVVVAMDLHVIGAWTGEGQGKLNPTTFSVTLDDGTLLYSSLANDDALSHRRQSFPDEPGAGGAGHPAALGAYKLNTLGVRDGAGRASPDSVYRLVFTTPHTDGKLKLTLSAANLPGSIAGASWAVDNAVVYAVGDSVDLERVRTAARDAVMKTSMGLPGDVSVKASSTPVIRDSRLLTFGNAGAFEATPTPMGENRTDSILADALDAESRLGFSAALPSQGPDLAMGIARELALLPAVPGAAVAFVPAPAPARAEQQVVRRVSSLVYQSRFNDAPGAQWDKKGHASAPRGERFAGPFGSEGATLTLSDIPDHDQLIIDADLYTIGDWSGAGSSPSKFIVTLDGQPVLAETFANEDGTLRRTQSFPGGGSRGRLPGAEATSLDALGYAPIGSKAAGAVGDASYHIRIVVPHSKATGALRFAAAGLSASGKTPAVWGLDNVTVVSSGDKAMSYGDATGVEPDDNADDGDYMNPFVRAPGEEWTVSALETSPSGESFLGPLHNQTAALTVKNFPQHTHLVIATDVIVVGDWQGNTPDPSRFSITLSDGSVICATSFATDNGAPDATQDYPDTKPAKNLPGAGAFSVGTMGYTDAATKTSRDAVYRLLFTLPHTSASETISFTVSGLRGDSSRASWGLDNVSVSTFDGDNPGGGGGAALGDAGGLADGYGTGGSFGGYAQSDNPFVPSTPGNPGGGGGGGGGGGNPPPPPPTLPAPGAAPALLVGLLAATYRRRRA